MKVVKFGGSSVASAAQFKKVKKIVLDEPARKIVVTSACGKASKDDYKVTDLLYLCYSHIQYGVPCDELFSRIEEKYLAIKKQLRLKLDLAREFDIIRQNMTGDISVDYLVSRGEYLAALMLAEYLDADFVDAKDIIIYNYDGTVDMHAATENIKKYLKSGRRIVVPGFYGAYRDGSIRIMSRGGSDFTGAVLANITDASIYENWTDVSGILVADPRIVDDPAHIKRVTYSELRELSYMGANVLQDEAVFPMKSKNIPINIRNTNAPEDEGTIIVASCEVQDKKDPPGPITGITGKKDYTVINIVKNKGSSEVGCLRKLLEVFEQYQISIESIPMSVDTIGIVVESKAIEKNLYEIIGTLQDDYDVDDVHVLKNMALMAVVGRGMRENTGISGKLFAELGKNKINISTINQGSDELSIIVGVDNDELEHAIRCIYNKFIR